MSQFDEDGRTLALLEVAAWLGAWRKAQSDFHERNRQLAISAIQRQQRRRRKPWHRRLWHAITKGAG